MITVFYYHFRISLDIPTFSSLPTEDTKDVFRDSPHTYTDLDTERPYNEGLLDSNRPSLDDSSKYFLYSNLSIYITICVNIIITFYANNMVESIIYWVVS